MIIPIIIFSSLLFTGKFQSKILKLIWQLRSEIQITTEARRVRATAFKIGEVQIPLQSVDDIRLLEALMTPQTIATLVITQ